MKIVTQLSPDLDACLSVWLLRRFGGYGKAQLAFVSTGNKLPGSKDEGVVYVDTSGGKYDHHHTNERICAASLVFHDLKLESDLALKELVDFATLVDHGLVLDNQLNDLDLVHIIYGLNAIWPNSPENVIEISSHIFDGLYTYLGHKIQATEELKHSLPFQTTWGPGVGLITSNRQVRHLAHRRGFKVFVYVDPKSGFRGFLSPGSSGVDFTEKYRKLKEIEPGADWFLHASRELLLCGSAKAPEKKLSYLPLETLIALVSI